jgi:MFS family permease
MPPGFHRLIATQFLSSLADNALLIVAIALLHERGSAPWLAPLLKVGFIASYVVLAPFVGALADTWPKARLMAWMNGAKLLGALSMAFGVHPLVGFAVVGFGAAAYAPAKYGLLTEIVPAHRLVAANGWIEVAAVGAVLLGAVLGGVLVHDGWLQGPAMHAAGMLGSSPPLVVSVAVLVGLYGCSSMLNAGLRSSGVRYAATSFRPRALWRDHLEAQARLWRDPQGGLSLAATTVFWGVGATLQFIVLRWADEALGLPLSQAAMLQGVVAVGVVVGASAAARWVSLSSAPVMLAFGIPLGLALPMLTQLHGVAEGVVVLALAGAAGGALVVPLNALLQHRGCQLLSAGRSIAVQGCNENASVLLMLGAYSALYAMDVPLPAVMVGLGLLLAMAMVLLWMRGRRWMVGSGAVQRVPRS